MSRQVVSRDVIDEIQYYWPSLAENSNITPLRNDAFAYVCELEDGSIYLYDSLDNSARRLRHQEDEDEEYWRRNFGWLLNRKMRFKGITGIELSEMTGISEVSISNYINGKSSPSGYNIRRIERALNCEIGELTSLF